MNQSKEKGNNMTKKFTYMVYDRNLEDDGSITRKPIGQNSSFAASFKEIQAMYHMCEQDVELLNVENSVTNEVDMSKIRQKNSQVQTENQVNRPEGIVQVPPQSPNGINQVQMPQSNIVNQKTEKKPIEYYTIGGVEIKNDNGKIYQKQWVRLMEEDVRLVNTNTNKIIPMKDKHIEIKKWVLVEKSETDND